MSDKPANGHLTLRTFLIILGLLVTVLITVFGVIGSNTKAVSDEVINIRDKVSDQGERISTSEANVTSITSRLDKIDDKLDKILLKIK